MSGILFIFHVNCIGTTHLCAAADTLRTHTWYKILHIHNITKLWLPGLMSFKWQKGSPLMMTWWRHQMETFSALLAHCAGNSPVTGEFPSQRPVTPSFDIFFNLRLKKRLSKQSWGWLFETQSRPLWRHCDYLLWFVPVRCSLYPFRWLNWTGYFPIDRVPVSEQH